MWNKKTIYQKCSLIQTEIFYKSLNKQLFRMTYKMVRAELKIFFKFIFSGTRVLMSADTHATMICDSIV